MSDKDRCALAEAEARDDWGGKASALSKICNIGGVVPPAVVLGTAFMENFLISRGVEIESSPKSAFHAINNAVWRTEELRTISDLAISVGFPLCVRSSHPNENIGIASLTGLFRSHVNVRSLGELATAVRDVWASGFEADAMDVFARTGIKPRPMAVIFQRFIDSEFAGVSRVSQEGFETSASYGLCSTVTEGRWGVDRYATGLVASAEAGRKSYFYRGYDNATLPNELRSIRVPGTGRKITYRQVGPSSDYKLAICEPRYGFGYDLRNQRILTESYHIRLEESIRATLRFGGFGSCIVEWCADSDCNLIVLQVKALHEQPRNSVSLRASGQSPGIAAGRAVRLGSAEWPPRPIILVVDDPRQVGFGMLGAVDGVVFEASAELSHIAVAANELGIPSSGVNDPGAIGTGSWLKIDGNAGEVIIDDIFEAVNRPLEASRSDYSPMVGPASGWIVNKTVKWRCDAVNWRAAIFDTRRK